MRLIDADALMNVIRQHEYRLATKQGSIDYGMFTLGIQQAVDEQQTIDAIPVVRCRDCVNRQNAEVCPMCYEEIIEWDDDGYMEWDCVLNDQTEPDGFCHYGERKEGADNEP